MINNKLTKRETIKDRSDLFLDRLNYNYLTGSDIIKVIKLLTDSINYKIK